MRDAGEKLILFYIEFLPRFFYYLREVVYHGDSVVLKRLF